MVEGVPWRTIWLSDDGRAVEIIDQTLLPHAFVVARLSSVEDAAAAIRDMRVRGAPLIGATAAWGIWLALRADASDASLERSRALLLGSRPTAVNLRWALDEMDRAVRAVKTSARAEAARARAARLCDDEAEACRCIAAHGLPLLRDALEKRGGGRLNVLTHCNAGWLATVDWGTALAPIYLAHDSGMDVHVWVDETRPRGQGAALTAWELGRHGVPHHVVADNAGGHLMQHAQVDLCIVGSDRTTARGDVCNKIGTYLKALAARDNGVPFYAALPVSSIDFTLQDGLRGIPIEERDPSEVTHARGRAPDGRIETVQVVPDGSPAANPGFDVTPARIVSALITDRGVVAANADGIASLRAGSPE